MATYLDRILVAHRQAAAADARDVDALIAKARRAGPTRGFAAAIAARHRPPPARRAGLAIPGSASMLVIEGPGAIPVPGSSSTIAAGNEGQDLAGAALPGSGRAALPGSGRAALPGSGRAALPGSGRAALPGSGRAAWPGSGRAASPAGASGGGARSGRGASGGPVAIIAEIKRRSPSKGPLAPALDPAGLAGAYQSGGATCLSVLTDIEFFGGSPADLMAARASTGIPVLRKDFTVSAFDVCDARLMGADALLLIAAALSPTELSELLALSAEVGIDALVEVHDEAEAERALAAGATLIGVNQRDLATFEVDEARAERVAQALPPEVTTVAESGIRGPDDVARLAAAGFCAVLVGESLVTAPNPAGAVSAMARVGV
jgi:indole-3-glycerol phosphate synthase